MKFKLIHNCIIKLIVSYYFISVYFSIVGLVLLMTKKLKELHPDYIFKFSDLTRPRKSRTLEIFSFLLNAVIFDQGNRCEINFNNFSYICPFLMTSCSPNSSKTHFSFNNCNVWGFTSHISNFLFNHSLLVDCVFPSPVSL